ncbi:MAG: hypothetical protein ACI30M_05390 [Muribaculaceae bacterium]
MPLWKRVYRAFDDYSNILSEFQTKIKTTDYDILHLVSSASVSLIKDWVMLREAKKNGLKTILHFHFGRIPELCLNNNWEWKLVKKVVGISDKVVVLDRLSYQSLFENGFRNVEILPNPISPLVGEIVKTIQICPRRKVQSYLQAM